MVDLDETHETEQTLKRYLGVWEIVQITRQCECTYSYQSVLRVSCLLESQRRNPEKLMKKKYVLYFNFKGHKFKADKKSLNNASETRELFTRQSQGGRG